MVYRLVLESEKPVDDKPNDLSEGFSETIPTGTNAGDYYVWYGCKGNDNYEDSEVYDAIKVTINKKPLVIGDDDAPTGINQASIGDAVGLISADGSRTDAIYTYAATDYKENGNKPTDDQYKPLSEANNTIKEADAGTYYIWYRLEPKSTDTNHTFSDPAQFTATITAAKEANLVPFSL